MGNRVKGKTKPKSVKAASHSGMGSKRKLSRMGKKQKKHHAGVEATFIGRSAALKKLQVTLKDFRRLCILKGVYPREPRGRTPGNKKGQVFYHVKDLRALAHEPLLDQFRQFKAFMKKVRGHMCESASPEFVRQRESPNISPRFIPQKNRFAVLQEGTKRTKPNVLRLTNLLTLCITWLRNDTLDSSMPWQILTTHLL